MNRNTTTLLGSHQSQKGYEYPCQTIFRRNKAAPRGDPYIRPRLVKGVLGAGSWCRLCQAGLLQAACDGVYFLAGAMLRDALFFLAALPYDTRGVCSVCRVIDM